MLRRLLRKAKKNRALVATATFAVVAALTAGGVAVRSRVVAGRLEAEAAARAAIERELGQDVKEMEWFLRTAHLLPLHDVTRERAIVRDRMKRIEERAASGSAMAIADYAVGCGHMALHEDVEAERRLRRALEGGVDTPELHYALGLVLGRIYQQALAEARRAGDRRWIERRALELEAQYLRPAVASMEKSRAVRLESPSYLEGLVAFYEKDHERAVRLARMATVDAPWFYEARALEAEVLLARGVERKDRGDSDAAARDLAEAARLYDAAAEVGRSDALLYEGSAEALVRTMEMDAMRGVSPLTKLALVLSRAEMAARAMPGRSAPLLKVAHAYDFVALHLLRSGEDPRASLALLIGAAERALAAGGARSGAHERLASAYGRLGDYELSHGLDPRGALDAAVTNAEMAVGAEPNHPWTHISAGLAHDSRAVAAMHMGGDPAGDLRAALVSMRRAVEIDGESNYARLNTLWIQAHLAQSLTLRGVDPRSELGDVAAAFAQCVRTNPNEPECHENMGIIALRVAEWDVAAGVDPRESLARAEDHLVRAAGLVKEFLENRQYLAALHLLRARVAMERGEDPAPALGEIDRVLEDCYRLDARDPSCALTDARRALLTVELAPAARRIEAARRALSLARAAVQHNPRDADARQVLAEAERRLVTLAPAGERAAHLEAGIAACVAGLGDNRRHPRLHATLGALRLLALRDTGPSAARIEAARRARDALREAAALNPLLSREVAPLVAEADRLIAAP